MFTEQIDARDGVVVGVEGNDHHGSLTLGLTDCEQLPITALPRCCFHFSVDSLISGSPRWRHFYVWPK